MTIQLSIWLLHNLITYLRWLVKTWLWLVTVLNIILMGPSPYYYEHLYLIHGALCWIYNLAFSLGSMKMFIQTILHQKHQQDWEHWHHLLSSWCLEDWMRCPWSPLGCSRILPQFVVLIVVNPCWRWYFCMCRDRNTVDLVCQVSHGYTDIYLGWALQTIHHHPMELLESLLWRRLSWCPNYLWEMGSWGDTGCSVLNIICPLPRVMTAVVSAGVLAVMFGGSDRALIIWGCEH